MELSRFIYKCLYIDEYFWNFNEIWMKFFGILAMMVIAITGMIEPLLLEELNSSSAVSVLICDLKHWPDILSGEG